MPNYDLYTELALDKDMPPVEIGALLDERINTLLGQGYQRNSPEVDQLSTARAILSDPYKRNIYEAALAGPDGVIDVTWLHNLADSSAAPVASQAFSPGVPLSYDASEASSLGSHSSELRESDPSTDVGYGNAEAQASHNAFYGGQQYSQPAQYAQHAQQSQYGAGNSGGQYNSGGVGNPVPPAPAKPQFDAASLSVAGRDRSQSKAYLACLAIMVIGMIYPLILMLTADDADLSIFKGILFAIAHTAAWIGIAEIIWGVRRIVGGEETSSESDLTNTDK